MSIRVPYDTVLSTVKQAFLQMGLSEAQAQQCAEIHTESSLEGIESHGLNRVPRFAEYVLKGWVDLAAKPELVGAKGAVENYDGHLGIGVLNATFCMDRAVALAKEHGIGCVALKNTTHWMRGGSYAWQAAQAGFIGISWTNTESCMPMWGSKQPGVGNNPFCIAIPAQKRAHRAGYGHEPVRLRQAGALYRLAGKQLPYPGGFDKDGNLTSDPGAIEASGRILPTGYWKGSGMAIALDLGRRRHGQRPAPAPTWTARRAAAAPAAARSSSPTTRYLFGGEEEIQAKWGRPCRRRRRHRARPRGRPCDLPRRAHRRHPAPAT